MECTETLSPEAGQCFASIQPDIIGVGALG